MNNPFDWENYKPQIDLKEFATAAKRSYQQTAQVNRRRQQGIEPGGVALPDHMRKEPEKFATDMPSLPYHPSTVYRKKKDAK